MYSACAPRSSFEKSWGVTSYTSGWGVWNCAFRDNLVYDSDSLEVNAEIRIVELLLQIVFVVGQYV